MNASALAVGGGVSEFRGALLNARAHTDIHDHTLAFVLFEHAPILNKKL